MSPTATMLCLCWRLEDIRSQDAWSQTPGSDREATEGRRVKSGRNKNVERAKGKEGQHKEGKLSQEGTSYSI